MILPIQIQAWSKVGFERTLKSALNLAGLLQNPDLQILFLARQPQHL